MSRLLKVALTCAVLALPSFAWAQGKIAVVDVQAAILQTDAAQRRMTAVRDQAIWATLDGKKFNLAAADAKTHKLPPVKSNYKPSGKNGNPDYEPGKSSQTKLTLPDGYKMKLFASEKEFTDLANPV